MDEEFATVLEKRLSEGFPKAFGVRAERRGAAFAIRIDSRAPILRISFGSDGWMVDGPHGHAHLGTAKDALDLTIALLSGKARFASEYRGETLSADWIEVWDGEAFEVRHTAGFLSPFDRDEWTLWPGERWRVVRTTIALGSPQGEESFETYPEEPSITGSWSLNALDKALGPPVDGMRWTMGASRSFVFQVPKGWRLRTDRREERDDRHNQSDLAPADHALVLRIRSYFRNADDPNGKSLRQTFRPLTVKDGLDFPEKKDPAWENLAWTLLFSDGEREMMGVAQLFFREAHREEAERLRHLIEPSLCEWRFVPGRWRMVSEG